MENQQDHVNGISNLKIGKIKNLIIAGIVFLIVIIVNNYTGDSNTVKQNDEKEKMEDQNFSSAPVINKSNVPKTYSYSIKKREVSEDMFVSIAGKNAVEVVLRIVVTGTYNTESLKKIAEEVSYNEAKNDPSLNEVHSMFFDREDDIKSSGYTLAWIYWGPYLSDKQSYNPGFNDLDEKRSSYKIELKDIRDKITAKNSGIVTDIDQKISYRYAEILDQLKEPNIKTEIDIAKEKVLKEFFIDEQTFSVALNRVHDSKPRDIDFKLADALQKEFDDYWDKNNDLMSIEQENKADVKVAQKYGVSKFHVSYSYSRVNEWKLK